MAKFFVGQRVRVVGPYSTNGKECRITGVGVSGVHHGRTYVGYQVDIPHPNSLSGWCVYEDFDLRPLVPPHAPSELSYTELMDRCRAGEGVPA